MIRFPEIANVSEAVVIRVSKLNQLAKTINTSCKTFKLHFVNRSVKHRRISLRNKLSLDHSLSKRSGGSTSQIRLLLRIYIRLLSRTTGLAFETIREMSGSVNLPRVNEKKLHSLARICE